MSAPEDHEPTPLLDQGASIEVPANPQAVWQAIATGPGNAAWIFPADIDGREGGAFTIHREPFGPAAAATVTGWDPPHRFAFEEPLTDGTPGSAPRMLATEILVEARSGGTCIVRVVSSMVGDPDGWEDLLDGATEGWRMALTGLRSYLQHFAGQASINVNATRTVGRLLTDRGPVGQVLMEWLGLTGLAPGSDYHSPGDAPPLAGTIDHLDPGYVLVRAEAPAPALFQISAFSMDGAALSVNVLGHVYGPDRQRVAAVQEPRWNAWLADRVAALA